MVFSAHAFELSFHEMSKEKLATTDGAAMEGTKGF
jgi:hypothetical protein